MTPFQDLIFTIYARMRSHVNISSAIRRKLGIDRHETNIGIYVRKLLKQL